jgi:hypothetical protein
MMRFTGAAKRDPAVDRWLSDRPAVLGTTATKWFSRMRKCGDDVRELIHDGCPVACVDDAAFGYVNTFKDHVNIGFFHGAALEDPAGLLEGDGKRMRHVKSRPGKEPDPFALGRLIDAAYEDMRVRVAATRRASQEQSQQ